MCESRVDGYDPNSLLNKAGIHATLRTHLGSGKCLRQTEEIAYGSPAGIRCHTSSTGCYDPDTRTVQSDAAIFARTRRSASALSLAMLF